MIESNQEYFEVSWKQSMEYQHNIMLNIIYVYEANPLLRLHLVQEFFGVLSPIFIMGVKPSIE